MARPSLGPMADPTLSQRKICLAGSTTWPVVSISHRCPLRNGRSLRGFPLDPEKDAYFHAFSERDSHKRTFDRYKKAPHNGGASNAFRQFDYADCLRRVYPTSPINAEPNNQTAAGTGTTCGTVDTFSTDASVPIPLVSPKSTRLPGPL